MDKKDVRLAILASAILVGVPLIVNLVADRLSARGEDPRRRESSSDSAGTSGAPLHSRGRPIEQLAADLRRMRSALLRDQQRSGTRQLANRMAYDQLLMQACDMVGLSHDLHNTVGPEHDIERLRVEADLERAGIVLAGDGRSS